MYLVGCLHPNADRIAVWNGNSWNSVGSGLNGVVRAIEVTDSKVYLGGSFTGTGDNSVVAYRIIQRNGVFPSASLDNVEEISSTEVRLKGVVKPGDLTGLYYFEYGTADDNLNNQTELQNMSGSVDIEVNDNIDVVPNTTYYYRLRVQNEEGKSFSEIRSFISPPEKESQAITFNPLPVKVYGEEPFTLSATTTSGLPITYTSSDPTMASISGNTVTIHKAGTVTITASQPGDDNYLPAEDVEQTLRVKPEPIPFVTTWKTDNHGGLGQEEAYNEVFIPLQSYNGEETYNYKVYLEEVGNEAYNATFEGTAKEGIYIAFPLHGIYRIEISGDFSRIHFGGQSGFHRDKILTIEQWGNVVWTSMEQAFVWCVNLTSNATDSPDLSSVTNMGYMFSDAYNFNANIENWDVSKVTDMSYMFNGATSFNQSLASWDISMIANMNGMFDNSGLSPANYEATLAGWATLNTEAGETLIPTDITLGASGRTYCDDTYRTILDNEPYNWTFSEDAQNCTQTITFNPLDTKTYGNEPFDLTVTSTSGLPITYTSSDPTIARIEGSTVTIHKAGTVTITASQPGDAYYLPAEDVERTLTINKAPLTAKADNKTKTYGFANPALTITYTGFVNSDNVSSITAPTASTTATASSNVGTYPITPAGGSAANYSFTYQNGTLTITKADQTITFPVIAPKVIGDPAFALNATSTSGLDASYTSSNTSVATVSGNTVTITGEGTSNITATQPGNTNYNAALPVIQVLTVTQSKSSQTISFAAIADKTIGNSAFNLEATASSGLPVSFSSPSSKITIDGTLVTMLEAGQVTVFANQSGNDQFNPAPEVLRSFCIKPVKPTITLSGNNTEAPLLTSSSSTGNQWYLNNTPVNGATGPTFTVIEPGVYTVSVSVDNCTSDPSNGYSLIITGLDEMVNGLKLYPNPSDEMVHLVLPGSTAKETVVVVYDMHGRVKEEIRTSLQEADIVVREYAQGAYIFSVRHAGEVHQLKFIKK